MRRQSALPEALEGLSFDPSLMELLATDFDNDGGLSHLFLPEQKRVSQGVRVLVGRRKPADVDGLALKRGALALSLLQRGSRLRLFGLRAPQAALLLRQLDLRLFHQAAAQPQYRV